MNIEKITMKKTLLGGGKVSYPARKTYRPPFTKEFTRDIIPMVKSHPTYFNVTYARVVEPDPETEIEPVIDDAPVFGKGSRKGKK